MAQPLEAILESMKRAGLPQSLAKLLSYTAVELASHGQPSQPTATLQRNDELLQLVCDAAAIQMQAPDATQWLRDIGESRLAHRPRSTARSRNAVAHPDAALHRDLRAALERRQE